MKISGRAVLLGSALILSGGWFLFDFLASGYLSPAGDDLAAVRAPAGKTVEAAGGGSKQIRTASINPLSGITLDSLKETIERPLFNQTRAPRPKPEPQVAQNPEEPQPTAEDFTLLAIVVTDSNKTALIKFNKTNEIFRLKAGQSFSDWQVAEIGPKSVVIKNAELTFPLKLFAQAPQGMTPPLQQAPASDDEDDESDSQPEAISRLDQPT